VTVIGFHPLHRLAHAQCVPDLERPKLPAIAPLAGAVNGQDFVGDLGHDAGSIVEAKGDDLPDELPGAVILGAEPLDPLAYILHVLMFTHRLEAWLGRGLILQRLQV
jgi:hypothetical protein